MSLYVGWYFGGSVQVFDESTEESTFHKITKVEMNLETLDKALDELKSIVKVENVKQLVFVHNNFDTKICKSMFEKLTEKGFKSVYIQHWISNRLQTLLLKQNVEFAESQHFLLTIKGDKQYLIVWQFREGQIKFVKLDFIVPLAFLYNKLSSYSNTIVQLFEDFKFELVVNINFTDIPGIVRKLYPACRLVNQATNWTMTAYTATALWTAKRQHGLVDGVEVGNFNCTGLYLCSGSTVILNRKNIAIPLPFNWSSEWKLYESATTATLSFDGCCFDLHLPADRICRIVIKINKYGSLEIYVESKCTLGISLSQDSFYLTRSADSVNGKVISIGQFPAALRFDCDPPKLASSVSGENVIADAIEMLDPSKEEKNGWNSLITLNYNVEFFKKVEMKMGLKMVSASFVVGELFDDIKSLVTDILLDSEKPICIALSRFLSQKQQDNLRIILKLKQPEIYFIDEIEAATFGFSVEKARPDGVTLVVDLKTTGCVFSLFQIDANCCELLDQQEFSDLKSENVRQAMQILYSSQVSVVETNSAFEAAMNEIMVKFRKAVSDVGAAEQANVKNVLLIGSCHLVPKIQDFFAWAFFHAHVDLLEESELRRFAAVGSILLYVL